MPAERLEHYVSLEPIELRTEGGKRTAVGYGAVFMKLSQNMGGYVEQVAPGAFAQTLTQQDVRALFNHDPNWLLGRMSVGTLRAEEDGTGLRYEADLPNTTAGNDVAASLERGDLSGSSIGFRVIDEEWGETPQGFPLRTLKQVSLRDVGPVTFPAYTDTEAALRSLAESRSLDYGVVVAAAGRNDLRSLLNPPASTEEDQGDTSEEDGRTTSTVNTRGPRISWLY